MKINIYSKKINSYIVFEENNDSLLCIDTSWDNSGTENWGGWGNVSNEWNNYNGWNNTY